jgi:hypothetical protein
LQKSIYIGSFKKSNNNRDVLKNRIFCIGLLCILFLIPGCQYRKGKAFTWSETGDSIQYLVIDSGSGRHIATKIEQLIIMHERKGDRCQIIYLSDSDTLLKNKSILLFNSVLPDMKEDMLSKGFLGAFTTRQNITYLVVNQAEIDKYLTSSD